VNVSRGQVRKVSQTSATEGLLWEDAGTSRGRVAGMNTKGNVEAIESVCTEGKKEGAIEKTPLSEMKRGSAKKKQTPSRKKGGRKFTQLTESVELELKEVNCWKKKEGQRRGAAIVGVNCTFACSTRASLRKRTVQEETLGGN